MTFSCSTGTVRSESALDNGVMRAQSLGGPTSSGPAREAAMPLDWVPGQTVDRSSDSEQSPQKRLLLHRKLIAATVAGILAVLISLAYAGQPDPTWIEGIYDNADDDDAVRLVTDGTGASNVLTATGSEPGPVACMLLPEPGPIPHRLRRAQMSRAPPVEARDSSVSLPPNLPPRPSAVLRALTGRRSRS